MDSSVNEGLLFYFIFISALNSYVDLFFLYLLFYIVVVGLKKVAQMK